MDFQKEREAFEDKFPIPAHWIDFDGLTCKYICKYNAIDDQALKYQARWEAWLAAKAKAVPNTQALHDRLLVKSIKEHVESHIAEISVNDLFDKGWLAAMKCIQNNIDILEAQEPAND